MLGLIIGTVGVIGLVKVVRRFGFGRCARGWDSAHYGRGRMRGSDGRRVWLRWIFERLGTTPGQEKAIIGALNDLRTNRAAVREEAQQTRTDLAHAVSGGLIDDAALEETFARHDRLLARVRVSFVEATKQITEALDERQRKQFAEILQKRSWFGGAHLWSDPHDSVWA